MSQYGDSFFARVSWVLKRQPGLFDALRATSRSLGFRSPAYEKLAAFFQEKPGGTFVQIGANDGISNDPIREFIVSDVRWTGAFVEPVPYLLEQCRKNYRACQPQRFRFLNAAASATDGELAMWRFKEAELPHLPLVARQITSTDLDHLKKHFPDLRPDQVERITVPSLSFGGVLQQVGLTHADLVTVDAEGHEAPILESICSQSHKPAALLFESTHFDAPGWHQIQTLLENSGYELYPLPADCFARLRT